MNVWKGSMLFVVLTLLLMSAVPASAVTVTDDMDDVLYYREYQVDTVVNKPNLDITDVSYTIIDSEISLTMTVKGMIEDSDLISYAIYFGRVDEYGDIFLLPCEQCYQVVYSNEHCYYGYFGIDGPGMEPGDFGELTDPVSGNTLTATFEIAHFDPAFEVSGRVIEADPDQINVTDELGGLWIDVTTNLLSLLSGGDDEDGNDEDESDVDTTDEDTSGDDEDIILPNGNDTDGNGGNGSGTPGFEGFIAFVTLLIIAIILRKKRI